MRNALLAILLASTSAHADPTEAKCRAIARHGETWEDACERVYHVSPDAWSPDGALVPSVATAKAHAATARAELKAARTHEREIKRAHAADAKRERALKRAARKAARCKVETDPAGY